MTPELAALVERARHIRMTPAQRFEQRVSFVYGQLSEGSPLTKDAVRRMLSEGFGGH